MKKYYIDNINKNDFDKGKFLWLHCLTALPIICSGLFILYHGSNIWTCLINLKSIPSEPAWDINITFTLSPLILSRLVAASISNSLFGDNNLSPLIIIYFAGIQWERNG